MQNGAFLGGGGASLLKSVQSFQVTATGATTDQAITAVDLTNTIILWLGSKSTVGTNVNREIGRFSLTSTTNLRLTVGVDTTLTASCMVVEFQPGVLKSLQTGTIAPDSALTATITSVDVTKTMLFMTGFSGSIGNAVNHDAATCYIKQTSATVITAVPGATGATIVIGYMAAEFN